MIPILYAANSTDFNNGGIGRLIDCTKCLVTEERNGIFECEFSYPITGQFYSEISLDRIVKVKPNEGADDQLFRIYRINRPINGIVGVYCQHISYDLAVNIVLPFALTNDSAGNVLAAIFSHLSATSSYTYTATSTVGGTHDFNVETPISARAAIGGADGSVLDVFGGELEFDNFNIKLHQHRGQDSGVTILYGKNLTDIKTDTNMANSYTAILPYAIDEEDDTPVHLIDGSAKTIAISDAPTYGEPRVLAVDLTDRFDLAEEDITSATLQERANDYLAENDVKSISQNIEISFVQLWQTEEYKNIALLERVALCDTVTVRYEKLGVDVKAQVVKTVYNALNEKYEKIEIGNAKARLLDTLRAEAKEQGKKAVQESYSALQAAIDNATELITGQSGGHVILNPDATGKPQEILIMDTEDIQTATKVWRWNLGGLGYAHGANAYNGQYTTAITMDGAIVADFVTAGTMSGERIEAGTLSATKITTGIIKDANNYNYWNLETGEFKLTANTLIGDTTLSSYVSSSASSAASSSLTQQNVFNALTNNGALQGIYMYNGDLYINASYIKSGQINASLITTGSMSADRITTGILQDAQGTNYWNMTTGEFRLSANTKVGTASSNQTLSRYVSSAASSAAYDELTQENVFNALTDNGALQGVYMSGGELYINGTYIKTGTINANLITTGTISSKNSRTQFDLSNGHITLNLSNDSWLTNTGRAELNAYGITLFDSATGGNDIGGLSNIKETHVPSGVETIKSRIQTNYAAFDNVTSTNVSCTKINNHTLTPVYYVINGQGYYLLAYAAN